MATVDKQKFSISQFTVISVIHLLALYGALKFYSNTGLLVWFFAHQFFGTVGASIGLHRYFSHRSFDGHPLFINFMATIATLCFQGGPIFWAAGHRVHHKISEKFGDPYDASKGFWWSHIGWMFFKNPNGFNYLHHLRDVSDLRKNKYFSWLEINATQINLFFLVALFAVCALLGHVEMFFWLGPIRIVSVWHATWLINSYAHKAKFFSPKPIKDYRNSIMMCFLIGGDGYHDFHHKYPATPKHAPGNLHFDTGFYVLKVLSVFNLVKLRKVSYDQAPDYKQAM